MAIRHTTRKLRDVGEEGTPYRPDWPPVMLPRLPASTPRISTNDSVIIPRYRPETRRTSTATTHPTTPPPTAEINSAPTPPVTPWSSRTAATEPPIAEHPTPPREKTPIRVRPWIVRARRDST